MRSPVKQFNTICHTNVELTWMGAKPPVLGLYSQTDLSDAALTNLTFGYQLVRLARIAYLAVINEDKQLDT